MARMVSQVVVFLTLTVAMASVLEKNTDLNANGAFADLITVKTSYYRSLCDANPLTWNQDLADLANSTIWTCNLSYDVCPPSSVSFSPLMCDKVLVPTRTNHLSDGW